jgi:hypothetical protein
MKESGKLHDREGKIWVIFEGAHKVYGAIVAGCQILDTPSDARSIFKELEQHILRQELSFVDNMKETIRGFHLLVAWDGELKSIEAWDVQLFEGEISFRLSKPLEGSRTASSAAQTTGSTALPLRSQIYARSQPVL